MPLRLEAPPSRWLMPAAWLGLLLLAGWAMPLAEPLWQWLAPDARQLVYQRAAFLTLLGRHALTVGLAAAITVSLGLAAGIAVTRAAGRDFLPLVAQLASLGQTFPPVAVLALAVPALGFGLFPIVVALSLYGLLPVVRNTIAGLKGVDAAAITAARGVGMTAGQRLWQVELPLAAPVILAGVRTSITINIATAALGATVGASNLGDPIIAGIVNGNTAYVVQGTVMIALLALSVDSLFSVWQQRMRRT
ncbi:ABC transporter permease [Halomonas garicola]|uniref:ABC transporter permease n=1 Tax=Halomonas garicola TaxID=1690008 RepID=UPI002897F074|nr:ABC transporter permease [Halomonas garicola]